MVLLSAWAKNGRLANPIQMIAKESRQIVKMAKNVIEILGTRILECVEIMREGVLMERLLGSVLIPCHNIATMMEN